MAKDEREYSAQTNVNKMTISEAAKQAEVNEKTIRYNIKMGKLKAKKVNSPLSGVGYYVEIDKNSFTKWNEARKK